MAQLRYRVVGPVAVAGVPPGDTFTAAADPDEHGRHTVGAELINLAAALASGLIEPLSKAAGAPAGAPVDE